jgi:hypothetical protein
MEVIIERACGMDVHKDSITACIITPEGKEIQTFSTKTVFLLKLIDWIKEHGCTHVAMESTGVFWKPIVNILLFPIEINGNFVNWFDTVGASLKNVLDNIIGFKRF